MVCKFHGELFDAVSTTQNLAHNTQLVMELAGCDHFFPFNEELLLD